MTRSRFSPRRARRASWLLHAAILRIIQVRQFESFMLDDLEYWGRP
jgi:hypothetical protein